MRVDWPSLKTAALLAREPAYAPYPGDPARAALLTSGGALRADAMSNSRPMAGPAAPVGRQCFLRSPRATLLSGRVRREDVMHARKGRGPHPGFGLVPVRKVVLAMRSPPGAERFVDGARDGIETVGRRQEHEPRFGALRAPGKGGVEASCGAGCPRVTPECHWTQPLGGISSETCPRNNPV